MFPSFPFFVSFFAFSFRLDSFLLLLSPSSSFSLFSLLTSIPFSCLSPLLHSSLFIFCPLRHFIFFFPFLSSFPLLFTPPSSLFFFSPLLRHLSLSFTPFRLQTRHSAVVGPHWPASRVLRCHIWASSFRRGRDVGGKGGDRGEGR